MKRFVEGEDRRQATSLPECLDDYVTEDNPVRVVEAFIDELDMTVLGFEGMAPAATGPSSVSCCDTAEDLPLCISYVSPSSRADVSNARPGAISS